MNLHKSGFKKNNLNKRYINYFYKIIQKKLEIKQSLYNLKKICVNHVRNIGSIYFLDSIQLYH
jgi:hypothetical protein